MLKLTNWTPKSIKQELLKHVVGQDDAVSAYSVVIYNTLLRKGLANKNVKVDLAKSILLVAGDTGTGKTYLAQKAEELFGINVILVDGSRINGHGWAGTKIEDHLVKLENKILKKLKLEDRLHISEDENAREFVTELYNTIIFIDEFDKLFVSHDTHNKDATQSAQASLLKFLEGDTYKANKFNFDTSAFSFILSGVFEDAISEGEKTNSIGFTEQERDKLTTNLKERLSKVGVGREILGRITRVTKTNKLTQADLAAILERVGSPISHYKNVFTLNDATLTLNPTVINKVAETAFKSNLGARALKEEVDKLFEPLLFDIDSYDGQWVHVTDVVDEKLATRVGDGIYSEVSREDDELNDDKDLLNLLKAH